MTKHLQNKIYSQLVIRREERERRSEGRMEKGKEGGMGQRVGGGEGERLLRILITGLWSNFQDIYVKK